jgi:hypothetical protein
VKRTFNDIALQPALAEPRLGVRADIIGGVKFTADVVHRDLEIARFDGNGLSISIDCRSATVTQFLDSCISLACLAAIKTP